MAELTGIDALAEKIKEPQFADMNDEQLVEAINSLMIVEDVMISTRDVEAYAVKKGFWSDVDDGRSSEDATKRKLCKNVMAWIDRMQVIDPATTEFNDMIQGLLYFTIITQTNVDDILALSKKNIRWVDQVGLGTVGIGLINNARSMS